MLLSYGTVSPLNRLPSRQTTQAHKSSLVMYIVLDFIPAFSSEDFAFHTIHSNRTISLHSNKSSLLSQVAIVDSRRQLFWIRLGLRPDFAEKFCLLSSFLFFASKSQFLPFLCLNFLLFFTSFFQLCHHIAVEWKRNLVAHGDGREEKWRGKRRMEWVAKQASFWLGTVHPVLLQSFFAYPHSKKASTRLNWHPRRYKWTRPFRWKSESGFCACAITFHLHSTFCRTITIRLSAALPTNVIPSVALPLCPESNLFACRQLYLLMWLRIFVTLLSMSI